MTAPLYSGAWEIPGEWAQQALCLEARNPDAWFPELGDGGASTIAIVKRICARCPVRLDCLDYALRHEAGEDYRWGIYGGLGPRARYKLAGRP